MERRTLVMVGTVVAVVVVVVVIVATTTSGSSPSSPRLQLPPRLDPALCPAHYGRPRPVVLVSVDGLRPEYLERGRTPTLALLAAKGVRAATMHAVYPTKTFPNHYSIVTGLFPESHGIIDNAFWAPERVGDLQGLFTLRSPNAKNGSWWGGQPIWNTLTRQGKKSASVFWPGSDVPVDGLYPTHWRLYNGSLPDRQRVNEVLEFVSLPRRERPSWVSVYFSQVDSQGHSKGPRSPEVDEALAEVDEQVEALLAGLSEKGLLHCVNVLLVSDHGMTRAPRHVHLPDLVPDIAQTSYVIYGATSRISLKNHSHEAAETLVEQLTCATEGVRAFLKEDLPKRLHYQHNPRIDPVVLDLDPGNVVLKVNFLKNGSARNPFLGQHGYDYLYPDMDAVMMGYGPDLVQGGVVVAPFLSMELYNLMCALTGVQPDPNNGTWGALHHLLARPPPYTILTEKDPEVAPFVPGTAPAASLGCSAHQQDWSWLQMSEEEHLAALSHQPWGSPRPALTHPASVLLFHRSHVTGYSSKLKTPLWTSFTVSSVRNHHPVDGAPPAWAPDPRLQPHELTSCTAFAALANYTTTPLFPLSFEEEGEEEKPQLLTNAVPLSHQLSNGRWQQLVGPLLHGWLKKQGPLNVVLGPVFDADRDSHLDQPSRIRSPAVPSDMFAVVTRCMEQVASLVTCPLHSLDAIAFIYPHHALPWPCASGEQYALMYSARVRDVELATGLHFFPNLTTSHRLNLTLRVQTKLW